MNRSEQINELATALSKAQAKIEGAVKDKSNPAFRSKYADLGACWDAIREPLSSNGLSVLQFPRTLDGFVEVETLMLHSSGQYVSDVFAIPVSKPDAHGYMSATTYARRGGLMAIAGIAPVDDDGNAAVGKAPATSRDPIGEARNEIEREAGKPLPSQYSVSKAAGASAKATAWTDAAIATVAKLATEKAIIEWCDVKATADAIDKLQTEHPAQYDRLMVAIDARRDAVPHTMQV